jgi:predicted RNase H-like HicB family nuclease
MAFLSPDSRLTLYLGENKLGNMAKTVVYEETVPRGYGFTVVFEPLEKTARGQRNGRKTRLAGNPGSAGYQVTVPLLTGLITYGRTLNEAGEMARDAIKCHLEGLRKDGERIPDERTARKSCASNLPHRCHPACLF